MFCLSWPGIWDLPPDLLLCLNCGPLVLQAPEVCVFPDPLQSFPKLPLVVPLRLLCSCNPLKRSNGSFPHVQVCSFPLHPCEESCIPVGNNPPQSSGCSGAVSPGPCLDGCPTLGSEVVRGLPVLVSWGSCPSLFPTSMLVPCFL